MPRWSRDQVLALAPDARSVAAARRLARPGTWSGLGSTDSLVWGRCQGSGKDPYQVTVDLSEPAFRCSCPSRKQPCKHGLALLLLWFEGDGSLDGVADAPGWAAPPIPRPERGARRAADGAAVADPEAQARRRAERLELMDRGLDDLERWLFDLVRGGLAAARAQPYAFWDTAAARLVDAQLPGLAERVRAAATLVAGPAGVATGGAAWAHDLLDELGLWWLAVRGWRRRDDLDEATAANLRVVLGWPRASEEVLAGPHVADRWHIVGLREDGDDRLRSQRTWLWGEATGGLHVLLDFAAAGQALRLAHVLGSVIDADLALYPGSHPRRAMVVGVPRTIEAGGHLPPGTPVEGALETLADAVATNPFCPRVPVSLAGVRVTGAARGSVVVDDGGCALPLRQTEDRWRLLALTAGRPVDLFGEWDGRHLHLCTVASENGLVGL